MLDRISDIVRAGLERTKYSLSDLSIHSQVPLTVLAALDEKRTGITTTQLRKVAEVLFLDFTALLHGQEIIFHTPSVFLRHAPIQDFDDRDARVLDEALEQGRCLAKLQTLLGMSGPQAGTFTQRGTAVDHQAAPAQQGYQLAREVRRWMDDTAQPLGDMTVIVEGRFGIAILVRSLASQRVTAVSVRASEGAAVVLAAEDIARARNPLLSRVYTAHELCHVLYDPSQGGLHIVVDVVADQRVQAAEQRASAFAAELLLPLDGLKEILGPPQGIADPQRASRLIEQARNRFGTPHEIAANHLCNLQFIDAQLRTALVEQKTRFTSRMPEVSLPRVGEPSMLVAEYTRRAHQDGLLTDGDARSLLGLDRLAPLPWEGLEL